MKKILGIVAVVLFVGAPVFGQTAPYIKYTLQLGGNNHADTYENQLLPVMFDTTSATTLDTTVLPAEAKCTDLLTWSVLVEAGGAAEDQSYHVAGVANVVWDLKLERETSPGVWEVVPGFGLGSSPMQGAGVPNVAGFLSLINDGLADGTVGSQKPADPLEGAAFTYAYAIDVPGPARIWDELADGGPHLGRYQYPSTLGWPDGSVRGVSQAPGGWLMGMGAGYTQFEGTFSTIANTERGGVGLPLPNDCGVSDLPIAEGQLNMCGLPGGTYRLALIPGRGNNVLWLDASSDCVMGDLDGGNFAQAAPVVLEDEANGIGDTIVFTIPVTGCEQPPTIVSAVSRKTQGGVDYDIPFNGFGTPTVECRANGMTRAVVTFDMDVTAADGSVDVGQEVVVAGGNATAATIAGNTLTIDLTTAVQNGSCVTITLSGIACSPDPQPAGVMADTVLSIVALRGDVTGNLAVDIGDINATKAASGSALDATAVMFRRDVTGNGAIDIGDINNVKSLSGTGFVGTCP